MPDLKELDIAINRLFVDMETMDRDKADRADLASEVESLQNQINFLKEDIKLLRLNKP